MTTQLTRRHTVSRWQSEALAGLLDLPDRPAKLLPELWHWTQLLETPNQSSLGPDGHPLVGVPAPPGAGLKRMFAGGRVKTFELLRLDEVAQRTTRTLDSVVKTGRSGQMTFVTVEHVITQGGRTCVVEENDLVYRAGTSTVKVDCGTPAVQPPSVPPGHAVLRQLVDETVLFRFSALTFNAHRIHYDSGWAAQEGYPGLVIHGPLQALLMGELHRRHGDGLVGHEFAYRLRAPAVGAQHLTVLPDPAGIEVGSQVLDTFGNVTATARVVPLPDDHPTSSG